MLDREWDKLKYFTKGEKPFGFGKAAQMDFNLMYYVDCYREIIQTAIIVRCGTQGYHLADWHRLGLAVDVLIDADQVNPLDLILIATRFPFTGIGFNPSANYDKMIRPVAFHFDVRPVEDMPRGVVARRWIWTSYDNELLFYPMNYDSLKRFGVTKWYVH